MKKNVLILGSGGREHALAWAFAKDDNEIALDWEKSYNQSVSLIGQENGLLYLFDQADNSVFSIKADSGDVVEKKLSLLWPAKADKVKIYQNYDVKTASIRPPYALPAGL